MKDANTTSKESFSKKMAAIIGIGILLIAAVYFGKQYTASKKQAEIAEFYNQFSDEEYTAFAKKLEKSIHDGTPEFFDERVDVASLLKFSNRDLTGSFNKRQTVKLLESFLNMGSAIQEQILHKTDFRFTRFYKREGIPHIIFRVYRPDALNFVDFTLGIKKGELIITDMYHFMSGELYSDLASDIYYNVIGKGKTKYLNLATYQNIQFLLEYGQYEEAYNELMAIPTSKRNQFYYRFLLITVLNFDNEKALEVIEEIKALKSDDERLLAYLDFQKEIINGDINSLNAAIDHLKKYVGDDVIFDLYRGIMYNMKSDYEKAEQSFSQLVTEVPDFIDGYYFKLYSVLIQNKMEEALEVIKTVTERFSLTEEDFIFLNEEYPELANSEAYKNIFKETE